MLTKTDAERIAQSINALRPSWPISSLMTFLGSKCKNMPVRDVAIQLTWVALDETTKTPARILEDGPWKHVLLAGSSTAVVRTIEPTDCVICSKPEHLHATVAYRDHKFESQLDRARSIAHAKENA